MGKHKGTVKEFFSSLFDFSFKEFITDKIIKVLYVLAAIYIFVFCLGKFFGSFKYGAGQAFLTLISSAVGFVVLMMVARAFLEIVIVVFRIADNVEMLALKTADSQSVEDIIDAEEVKQPESNPSCTNAETGPTTDTSSTNGEI